MGDEPTFTKYYIIYSLSYVVYGLTFTGIGPLIPYLAEKTHTTQTSYSFVFFCRAIGMILGTIAFKYLQSIKIFTYHLQIVISSFGIFLMCCSFTISTTFILQGISFLLNGFFFGIIETAINVSMILLANEKNIQTLFLVLNGLFGLGGLLGPIFVYYFQDSTFMVFGILMAAIAPAYFCLQNIENIQKNKSAEEGQKTKILPDYGLYLLCLLLFLYIGIICSVGGWISSYAVMKNIKTKQGASIYPSLFWGFNTFTRFFIVFLPGSSSTKLKLCIQASLFVQILSFAIKYFGFTSEALYFQSIFLGIVISPLFPMIYAISKEFGYSMRDDQVGNLVAAGPIGQGLLTMLCGELMDWIHIDMYFYLVIVFFIIILWGRMELLSILCSEKPIDAKQKLIEMNEQ